MRKSGAILLIACAILAMSLLPGRIQYWEAAEADYAIAAGRVAAIQPGSRQDLDLSDLIHLSALPVEISTKSDLTRLNLSNTNITDISSLAGLKKLGALSMNNVPIVDLSPLSGLRRLVDLSISRTWVFDLAPIAGLSRLEQLNLSYTAVKSLEPLLQLQELQQLTLYSSYAHDGSQQYFEKLGRSVHRLNNGVAYEQNYRPDWQYRLKIRYQRFRQSWMLNRPDIT